VPPLDVEDAAEDALELEAVTEPAELDDELLAEDPDVEPPPPDVIDELDELEDAATVVGPELVAVEPPEPAEAAEEDAKDVLLEEPPGPKEKLG